MMCWFEDLGWCGMVGCVLGGGSGCVSERGMIGPWQDYRVVEENGGYKKKWESYSYHAGKNAAGGWEIPISYLRR